MNDGLQTAATVERSAAALLRLIEDERARQCELILAQAGGEAAALRAQAHAAALARLRQAHAALRKQRDEALAAARARLATHRRLHEQQRAAALLQLAREALPSELIRLWQQPAARAAWVAQVLAAADASLPAGAWLIVHAPSWPAEERQALGAQRGTLTFEADPQLPAGLLVRDGSNLIDGSLGGILAGRSEYEAQLLRLLEAAP